MESAAGGVPERELAGRKHATIASDRLVAGEGAADDRDIGTISIAEDSATLGEELIPGLVAEEGAVGDRERAAAVVTDGSAAQVSLVVGQDVVGKAQGAAGVQNTATTNGIADRLRLAQRVGQGQAVDADGEPFVDVEDAVLIVAADGQQAGARPFDVQALVDG